MVTEGQIIEKVIEEREMRLAIEVEQKKKELNKIKEEDDAKEKI